MNATSKTTAATKRRMREVEPSELRTVNGGARQSILRMSVYFAISPIRLPPPRRLDPHPEPMLLVR
jgi:hypothetical protein